MRFKLSPCQADARQYTAIHCLARPETRHRVERPDIAAYVLDGAHLTACKNIGMTLREQKTFVWVVALVFLVVMLRTAWISDDAAITLRTVMNFLHGYGPTFNLDERVQAYTHPLWFLLLSATSVVTGNIFFATFLLSIACSLAAVWLVLSRARSIWAVMIVGGLFILSKAFVDFSTSGLENPLSHLLLGLMIMAAAHVSSRPAGKYSLLFWLLCSALYLSRPDLLVIVAPLALWVAIRSSFDKKQLLGALLLGGLPVVLWTAFSLYYYGFPFPNTAYAKLGSGIPLDSRITQGVRYLLHCLDRDPLTLAFIVLGCLFAFRSSSLNRCLIAGVVSYLAYVISIGGDFMEGRFLTAPLYVTAFMVVGEAFQRIQWLGFGSILCVFGLPGAGNTLLSNASYSNREIPHNGIADERGFYYPSFGLLTSQRTLFSQPDWEIGERRTTIVCGGLGFDGIFKGPGVHFIDYCGLADPLLARLPARYDANWRPGHFYRQLPTDYQISLDTNQNLLKDPATKSYWDSLRLVTRGPLNDWDRWGEIFRLNLGLDQPRDLSIYRNGLVPRGSEHKIGRIGDLRNVVEGVEWDAPGNLVFSSSIDIQLDRDSSFDQIDISLDNNDTYALQVLSAGAWVPIMQIPPKRGVGMVRHQLVLPEKTPPSRTIRLTAVSGDGMYSIGHLIVR